MWNINYYLPFISKETEVWRKKANAQGHISRKTGAIWVRDLQATMLQFFPTLKKKTDHIPPVCLHKGWINIEWQYESSNKLTAEQDLERKQVSPPTFFPWPHLATIYSGPNLDRRHCQTHSEKSYRMSDVGLKSLTSEINLSKPHLLSSMQPAQGGPGKSWPFKWPNDQILKSFHSSLGKLDDMRIRSRGFQIKSLSQLLLFHVKWA